MGTMDRPELTREVVGAIIAFSFCSSTMLLANKIVMKYLPMPGLVSVIQLVFATVAVLSMNMMGIITVDRLEWVKVRPYMLYILAFVGSIFANMQALNRSNVETVIVFRACTPIATSVIEYYLLGRAMPSVRSMAALGVVGFGAVMYCVADSELALGGLASYSWVSLYFVLIVFEMTYGKQLVKTVEMKSVWGSVLYVNIIAIVPMACLGLAYGDISSDSLVALTQLSVEGHAILLFSCVLGCCIGYCGWACRALISATSYTLVGVVNKFFTIFLNVLIWSKHSTPAGLASVCVCLAAGFFYKQPPLCDPTPAQKAQQAKTIQALTSLDSDECLKDGDLP